MIRKPVRARTEFALIAALVVAASSCAHYGGGGGAPTTPSLTETTWRIEESGGTAVADTSTTELRIRSDGLVSGSTGCNNFTGTATLEGSNLTFSPLATTRRACEGVLMDQERRILEAMQSVKRYSVAADGRLQLLGADGQALLRLTAAK